MKNLLVLWIIASLFCTNRLNAQEDPPENEAPTVAESIEDLNLLEDAPSTGIDLKVKFEDDNDPDDQLDYQIDQNTNTTLFTEATINSDGELLLDYAPDAFGSSTITVSATDTEGLTTNTSFTVTLAAVNDQPAIAASNPPEVLEDAGPQVINDWATFSAGADNENGQTPTYTIQSFSEPDLFAASPAVNASGDLSYEIAADASGTSSFDVFVTDDGGTANGGSNQSNTQTFTITVISVNDAPDFTASNPPAVNANAGTITISNWASFEPGAANEDTQQPQYEVLNITNPDLFASLPAINTNGDLTYEGKANTAGISNFDVQVKDDGGTANGGEDASEIKTFSITINQEEENEAPVVAEPIDDINLLEDAPSTVIDLKVKFEDDNDPDDQLDFQIDQNTNTTLFTEATINSDGELLLDYAPDAFGSSTITVSATDTEGLTTNTSFTVTLAAVNDQPAIAASNPPEVLEDAGPQVINDWATFSAGADNENGQTPTYTIQSISEPDLFAALPTVNASGDLSYEFAADAFGTSTFEVFVTDDGGTDNGGEDQSDASTFTIEAFNINDAPDFSASAPDEVNEDAGIVTITSWALFSPGPNEDDQQAKYVIDNISNPDLFSMNPDISSSGTLSFRPANDAYGSSTFDVFVTDDGGIANGGIDKSETRTFTNIVNPVNDAPDFSATNPPAVMENEGEVIISGWATFDPGAANEITQQPQYEVLNVTNQDLFASLPDVNNKGDLTYEGKANTAGISNFDVQVKDDGGTANGGEDASEIKTFSITINQEEENEAPVVAEPIDDINLLEDAPSTVIDLKVKFEDDNDPDDQLDFQIDQNTNTTLFTEATINSDGELLLDYAPDAFGSSTITVSATDLDGLTNSISFDVNLTAVNDRPEFAAIDIPVVLEDSGPQEIEGWATFYAGADNENEQTPNYRVRNISNQNLFSSLPDVNNQGDLNYEIAADRFGTSTFQVFVLDNGGTENGGRNRSERLTFTIEVININDAPDFSATEPKVVNEDAGSVTIQSWAVFSPGPFESNQEATYTVENISNPGLFSIDPTINKSGNLSFTPADDAFGSSTFDVYVTDDGGTANGGVNQSATKTFTNVVNAVNDAPDFTASNPPAIKEDEGFITINGWASFDPGAANENSQQPQYEVLNISNQGLFASLPAVSDNGDLTYEGKEDAAGSSNFDVRVIDNGGTANGGDNASEIKTFILTITQENDPPTVVEPIADINSLEDADSDNIDLKVYFEDNEDPDSELDYQVDENTNPALFTEVSINNTGILLLDYAPDANGQSSITVKATDKGGLSTTTSFEVNLAAVNDAPTFSASSPATILEDSGPQEIVNWSSFSAGPANEQGTQIIDSYKITGVTNPTLFSTLPKVNNNGTLTFIPADNQFGSSEFKVQVFDNGGVANNGVDSSAVKTFTITVVPVNDRPEFSAGDIPAVLEDSGPQELEGWATFYAGADNEDDQIPSYRVRNISNPDLFASSPKVNALGDLTYEIAANEFGSSTFELFVIDGGGTSNGGRDRSERLTFTIEVTGVNDAPDFTASNPDEVNEDTGTVTIAGWSSFTPGVNESMQEPSYTVENISNPDLFSINPTINQSGTLTYTPAINAFGSSTISVFVKDDGGTNNGGVNKSGTKTFTIQVNPVNDAPNFTAINPPPVDEDAGSVILNNWASFDAGASNENSQQPEYLVSNISNQGLFVSLPEVDDDGNLTYEIKDNVSGQSNFDVQVKDDGGTANGGEDLSIKKTFTITIIPINDAPQFTSEPVLKVNEDQVYTYNVSYTDLETSNEDLIVTATTIPEWLNLQVSNTSAVLTGTPLNEHIGSNDVTLSLSDGDLTTVQSFSINVANVNDPPYFTSNPATKAIRNEQYIYSINTEDDDPNDDVTLTVLELPTWLSYNATGPGRGELTGTPNLSHANQLHKVRLRAIDKSGSTANQQFDIEVVIVNTPPSITSSPVTNAADGELYQYNIVASDPDASDQLTFTVTNLPEWLTLTDNNNKTATLSGTPSNQEVGTHDVALRVTDAVGANDTQIFTITVSNNNDPPFFTSTARTVATEDTEYIYNITTSDPDIGDSRTLSAIDLPGWLSLTTNSGNGTLRGTPSDAQVGDHVIKLEVKDAANAKALQQFTLSVANINDEPRFTSIPVESALINQSYIYNITVEDDDIEDELKINVLQKPAWLNFSSSGEAATLSGTPSASDAGFHDVILRVEDQAGVQKLQEFTIKVNNLPVMTDFAIESQEDVNYTFSSNSFVEAYGDADGDDLTKIKITSLPDRGSLNLSGASVQVGQEIDVSNISELSYVPAANDFGNLNFEVMPFDGTDFSAEPATVTIRLLPVNDKPVLSGLNSFFSYKALVDDKLPVAENAFIEDIDNDSIAGLQIFFTARSFQITQDLLSVQLTGNIRGTYNEETGILNLLGGDTKENYIQVLQSLTYEYRGTLAPNYETRTINYLVDDGITLSEIRQQSIEMIRLDALVIPSGITPNNDGINDLWEIDNIELYPNCQVKIFTREGREIFSSTGYSEPWDGTHGGSLLPAGTYYYVIVLNDLEQETGDITIIK